MDLNRSVVETAIRSFLAEDLGYGDITANVLVDSELSGEGRVICKEDAVVAGIDEALVLLELAGCQGTIKAHDGDHVKSGTMILSALGPARALLGVERTLLNLLAHMSGVATATVDLVSIANRDSRGKVRIACTRKTLPGLRYFEKRAVKLGGGDMHRLRLDDAMLIKDNHLELAGSVGECVRKAKEKVIFTKKVEVEVTNADQAVEAAKAGADIILLDNMTPKEVERSVSMLQVENLRNQVLLEVSGAITHSAPAIDLSMEIHPSRKHR